MADVIVVGSGACGVHFAQTALERGHAVTLLDVGFQRPPAVLPDESIVGLKRRHDDPVAWLNGAAGEDVVYPHPQAKPYGFPPSKRYVFARPESYRVEAHGFDPMFSFAAGGLAEAWTGGSYELADHDFEGWPLSLADLQPYYATVATRIGISGVRDDIEHFSPFTAGYLDPLDCDPHSAQLLNRYAGARTRLQANARFRMGRSRVATLSRPHAGRGACDGRGRCLWGCPREALYAPSFTLRECQRQPRFRYIPGFLVQRVELDGNGRATGVIARPVNGGDPIPFRASITVLAAGALGTSRIYLETLAAAGEPDAVLPGLMDNRQVLIPFVTPSRIGSDVDQESYQFHHLALGIEGEKRRDDIHGQITTLRAASVHPIVQSLPFDLRASLGIFRRIRGALGVANVWLPDARDDRNTVSLGGGRGTSEATFVINYVDQQAELEAAKRTIRAVREALGVLGCIAPKGMSRILGKGASVHYAGTIPMSLHDTRHTTDAVGAVSSVENLYVIDGASFPTLPAKNLTFTLMANAVRIASTIL